MEIPLDFCSNASHKSGRFSNALPKKGLKFVLCRRNCIIAFNLGLMLFLAEVDFMAKKRGPKKYALKPYGTSRIEMIFTLLVKVVILYVRVIIIHIGILGLESPILRGGVCFAIFMPLNKQF